MVDAIKILSVFLLSSILSACSVEQRYRGVASPEWKELTGEQRQLIVDQAYEQEFMAQNKS